MTLLWFTVSLCRSPIHGRGLFCKKTIDAGEMVIEYSGNVIRSVLTDKREKYYDGKVRSGEWTFEFKIYLLLDQTRKALGASKIQPLSFLSSKGIGCYMFRIDDYEVVDATVHGNAARFINHSCEPNCYSRVITVDGQKHIVIFASRRIYCGEELTYDYKFPIEDASNKLPCNCGAKKCRKFLNWCPYWNNLKRTAGLLSRSATVFWGRPWWGFAVALVLCRFWVRAM